MTPHPHRRAAAVARALRPARGRHEAGRGSGRISGRGSGDDGFTLIETLVSLGLFMIVSLAAVLAVVTATSNTDATRDRVAAANVAQQEIARAQAMPRSGLTASPTASRTATVGSEPYTVTRSIAYVPAGVPCPSAPATDAPHRISVYVTVTWPGAKGRSVDVGTVLAC